MDPNSTAPVTSQPPTNIPPPPSGGMPLINPHYQAPQQPQPSSNGTSVPPPPPGGGQAVPNPHYVPPPLSRADDSIPAFIRNSVDVGKVRQYASAPVDAKGNVPSNVVAEENPRLDDPYDIAVFHPEQYDADSRNHELTHTYQDTRSGDLPEPKRVTNPNPTPTDDPYDYSGAKVSSRTLPYAQQMQAKLKGLQQARRSGKTIANFNVEQQAEMVRDYKKQHDAFLSKVKNGTATKKDLQAMSDLQNTYHPFIEQLAKMPGKSAKIQPGVLDMLLGRNMPTIDTRPDAPGLPSFATAGMGEVVPDPLMGGHSQPIRHKKK